jgi:Tfp pilus assembly protein PilN
MIKVNLVGAGRKKKSKSAMKIALPASFTPILLILIILGSAGGGYWWYAKTAGTLADLDKKKAEAEKQKAALEAVIKADQVFEARKKALENRVKIIESLQKNQVSPVVALDQLAEAVERTRWVWLSNLDQKDAALNMSGTATSLNAIADFSSNLTGTGFFKNVDPGSTQVDKDGNWSFTIKCEFSPPRPPAAGAQPTAGGN